MKGVVWQNVGLACLVCKSMLFPLKIALLRLNLKVVLTKNYKNAAAVATGHLAVLVHLYADRSVIGNLYRPHLLLDLRKIIFLICKRKSFKSLILVR